MAQQSSGGEAHAPTYDIQDYEDAVLATVSKRHKMEYIVTCDLEDFKDSPVDVILPDKFAEIVSH